MLGEACKIQMAATTSLAVHGIHKRKKVTALKGQHILKEALLTGTFANSFGEHVSLLNCIHYSHLSHASIERLHRFVSSSLDLGRLCQELSLVPIIGR